MRIAAVVGSVLVLVAGLVWAAEDGSVNLLTRQNTDGEISGWKSFHERAGTKTGDVWRFGSDGVLVCRGQPKGYLYTAKDYTNVSLTFEWRWPPGGKPGNGGVLLRVTGENKIWPKSLEIQLNNGQAGDFWAIGGYALEGAKDRTESFENKDLGRLTHVKYTRAMEKPAGQWNQCEVRLQGGNVSVRVNGQPVNEATNCEVAPGKIVLTAEGDEIHFRNLRLSAAD
jgi:hypothetical protein